MTRDPKFGWSLPPGVTNRMIDEQAEGDPDEQAFIDAFFDEVDKHFGQLGRVKQEHHFDALSAWLWLKMGEAYQKGYAQGKSDEAFAQEILGRDDPPYDEPKTS